ncbi:MAG: T9SS type A sorting domain-containing protein, partial [Bacteroidetes bacterium]|nr:T9SS type A sorting domain-containing protein [Bacteroidota bacterium]
MGRALLQVSLTSDRQVLELGSLPAGIYLLRLTDQKGHSQNLRFGKQ